MRIQYQAAKDHENFPVASFLLPKTLRKSVLAFYDYVRGLDNIADNGAVSMGMRQQQLIEVRQSVACEDWQNMPVWARLYAGAVASGQIEPCFGHQLWQAFFTDTCKQRYLSLSQLQQYCLYSAAPVGRFILHHAGEIKADLSASDALCEVLQLLNHLQDMQQDYVENNRIYLPQQWMTEFGVEEAALAAAASSPAVEALKCRLIAYCMMQLQACQHLPDTIDSTRLRIEISWIWQIAWRLAKKLQTCDPLSQPVRLSRLEFLLALLPSRKHDVVYEPTHYSA